LNQIQAQWHQVETTKQKSNEDRFRCLFFSRLIQAYAHSLEMKFKVSKDFEHIFQAGTYILRQQGLAQEKGSPLNVSLLT
jgi:hypothetical protein